MFKTIRGLMLLMVLINLSACTISPVAKETLSSSNSYSDFSDVKASVGKPMPDFTLKDSNGETVSLSQFKNKQAVMLLFYRGDWCPYCISQLEDYQNLLPLLEQYNIQLLAISPDDVATARNTQRRLGQDYIFLSDSKREVVNLLGVGNEANLPHPAIFVVDKKGDLRWYYASVDHKVRPTAPQVEMILNDLFK